MTDFYGLPARSISNAQLRVDVLTEVGPRLVRLCLANSETNLLAETPDVHWPDRFGEYHLRGGHRLAIAPEALGLSYVPDNEGVRLEDLPDGVCLHGPQEQGSGIRKTIEIHLQPDRPVLTLRHSLSNHGNTSLAIAPWAITQLAPGGIAVLPLRLLDHQRVSPDSLRRLPDRQLVLWPYASWQDERLFADDDYVWVTAQPQPVEFKIGALAPGWLGYLNGGVFFLKRFDPQLEQLHPDLNTNAQIYCNHRHVELESLAPLTWLEPGQTCVHVETWELYAAGNVTCSIGGLSDLLGSILP